MRIPSKAICFKPPVDGYPVFGPKGRIQSSFAHAVLPADGDGERNASSSLERRRGADLSPRLRARCNGVTLDHPMPTCKIVAVTLPPALDSAFMVNRIAATGVVNDA
jgi:hypothetical protein